MQTIPNEMRGPSVKCVHGKKRQRVPGALYDKLTISDVETQINDETKTLSARIDIEYN